ncbi:MAG: hypothetical protein AMXMBFR84_05550 [Candidatus Hydrogenedentota bacterium]
MDRFRQFAWVAALTVGLVVQAHANGKYVEKSDETKQLFNGKDLTGWYTFIRDRGRDADPKSVFTVQDGMIRISGEEWGCITTNEEFENYHLITEFKWGQIAHPPRENKARDSGILVHSQGDDGAYSGIWMHSIEIQLIEGGTGDLLVVGDKTENFQLTAHVAAEKDNGTWVYKQDGQPQTILGGRINWWGRDPDWKDEINFRGKQDVEFPVGEWNRLECIVVDGTITVVLNGVKVNECFNVKPTKGRIQVQSEAAEIFLRKVELVPIELTDPEGNGGE